MDSKEKMQKDVESALRTLHQTIDSLKEKVDKLCESSGCFNVVPKQVKPKKDDK
tara:strand:- start:377 stop:538 length:162 start_codon:yes stop_codon:yes gene_type:complete